MGARQPELYRLNDAQCLKVFAKRCNGKEHMMLSGGLENYLAPAMAYGIKEAGCRICDARTGDEADAAFEEWRASIPQHQSRRSRLPV